jgi:hypothetical protein
MMVFIAKGRKGEIAKFGLSRASGKRLIGLGRNRELREEARMIA